MQARSGVITMSYQSDAKAACDLSSRLIQLQRLKEIIMSKKAFIVGGIFSLLLSGLAQAAHNPLEPSYYVDKANGGAAAQSVMGDTSAYGNPANPLNPTFHAMKQFGAQWNATSANGGTWYIDSGNPLYPGFTRS
jgi:hypothetical protein